MSSISGVRQSGFRLGKATRVHLRWRDGVNRFVVVGLARDE